MESTTATDELFKARSAKAHLIAQVFIDRGEHPMTVAGLDDEGWTAAAALVGKKNPSIQTRVLVVYFVAEAGRRELVG